jgi:hypothetical protein
MRAIISLGCCFRCAHRRRPLRNLHDRTPSVATPDPRFKDVAKEAGLTVSHISPEKKYIVESMSGGAGAVDCDNDNQSSTSSR